MTSTSQSDQEYADQVREVYGLTCLPRWGTRRDWSRKTFGPKVARISTALGAPFNPWQRYTADIGLEVDPETGLLAYRGVDITVPRQSGKTTLLLPVAVHRALWRPGSRIIYGAQSGTAAREKWEDEQLPILAGSRAMRGRYRVRKANGREAILWGNGSLHGLTTNTEKSSHGKTLDLAELDEYFAQVDYRLDQACGPAMITRVNAQKWRVSTAGTSRSVPFNAMRKRGRAAVESGRTSTIAFFDWCGLPGQDRADPQTWLGCMPALCPSPVRGICRCSPDWRHTVTIPAVLAELEAMSDDLAEFDRAYLNISRDDGDVDGDPNVPTVDEWSLLADDTAPGGTVVAIAVDITPKRDHAAIVAAGFTPDGLPRIAVLAHGPGIDWVMGDIIRLHQKLAPVAWVVDEKSPAATLIMPMQRAGIVRQEQPTPKRGQLWIPTVPQLGAACGGFVDMIRQGHLIHLGEAPLTIAIAGASTRPLGDGIWAWARKHARADISPLVAATLAVDALTRFQDLATPPTPAAAPSTPTARPRPGQRLQI